MATIREFRNLDYQTITLDLQVARNAVKFQTNGRFITLIGGADAISADIRIAIGEGTPDIVKALPLRPADSWEIPESFRAIYIWNVPTGVPGTAKLLISDEKIKYNPSPQILSALNDVELRNDFFGAGLDSLASARAFFDNPRYKVDGGASTQLSFALNTTSAPEKQSYLSGVQGLRTITKESGTILGVPVEYVGGLYSAYLVDASKTGQERFIIYSTDVDGYGEGSLIWMEMDMRGNFDEAIWLFGWALFNNPAMQPSINNAFPAFVNRRNASATAQVNGMNSLPDAIDQNIASLPFHQGGWHPDGSIQAKLYTKSLVSRIPTDSDYSQQTQTFFLLPSREKRIEQAFIDNVGSSYREKGPTLGITFNVNWYYPPKAQTSVPDTVNRLFDSRIICYIANKKYLENYFNDLS